MPNRSLWNLDLPRVEYDNRARETRLRLEQSERLFAKRDAVEGYRCLRLLLLFLGNIVGGSQRRGRRTRSPDDKLPSQIGSCGQSPFSSDSLPVTPRQSGPNPQEECIRAVFA